MYVILVNDDNTLTTTKRERIMQRSKLVNNLWFLSHPLYKGYDMTNSTVLLEYVLPISKEYKTEILVKDNEKYEDHLKYVLPIDTELTSEPGDIEIQLTFILVDLDSYGEPVQRVRKIEGTTITITPIKAWSNIIPDSALSVLDQRIIKQDAQIKALNDLAGIINDTKADNLFYEDNKLQLVSNGKKIGDIVTINTCNDSDNNSGNDDTPQDNITGIGNLYYGTGVGNTPEITSELVFNLSHKESLPKEGYSFDIEITSGQQHIVIAYPNTIRDLKNVTYVQANDTGMAANFDKQEINLPNLDGQNLTYKIFTYGMAIPAITNMTFKITI